MGRIYDFEDKHDCVVMLFLAKSVLFQKYMIDKMYEREHSALGGSSFFAYKKMCLAVQLLGAQIF